MLTKLKVKNGIYPLPMVVLSDAWNCIVLDVVDEVSHCITAIPWNVELSLYQSLTADVIFQETTVPDEGALRSL